MKDQRTYQGRHNHTPPPMDELGMAAARELANLQRYQELDRQAGRPVRTAADHRRIVEANYGRGF